MAFCSFLGSSSTEIISSDSRLLSGGTAEKQDNVAATQGLIHPFVFWGEECSFQ